MSLKASLPPRAAFGPACSPQSAQAAAPTQATSVPAWLAGQGAALTLLHPIDLPATSEAVFAQLVAETAWRAETIRLFGRIYPQPRLIAWHGDAAATYRYAGLCLTPTPWTALLADLRDRIALLAHAHFNSVLLNYYRDERDSMGLHADDEPELGPEPVIASLSLGATRALLLRHKTNRALPTARIPLPDASLLIMHGTTQRLWKHGIEKRLTPHAPRLNLTFRHIRPIPEKRPAP